MNYNALTFCMAACAVSLAAAANACTYQNGMPCTQPILSNTELRLRSLERRQERITNTERWNPGPPGNWSPGNTWGQY